MLIFINSSPPLPSRASTYHEYRACIQMIIVKFWDKVFEISAWISIFLDRAQFLTWASRSIFLVASVLIIVPLSPPSRKEIRGRLKLRNFARFESAFPCLPWAISRASELYSHKFFSNITGLIWKGRYPLSKFSEVVWSRPKSVHICRLFCYFVSGLHFS